VPAVTRAVAQAAGGRVVGEIDFGDGEGETPFGEIGEMWRKWRNP